MGRRFRRQYGWVAALSALLVSGIVASPAAAEPGPGGAPPHPPAADTEATIVELVNTSGLYGGDVASATALTPYPTRGLENQRSVTTAQLVLDDPLSPGRDDILTYCIDLDTDTTVGVHYELGDWTAADVPNLPYVQWILQNFYPENPASPAAGTDAEKVRAVQGAIWYFTDQFVVSPFYPSERAAVKAIVDAAQDAVDPTPVPPPLPTLTIAPTTLDASVPGQIVGPFAVGGSVDAATLRTSDTQIYTDAAGTVEVFDGDSVGVGAELWARFDPAVADPGFSLEASAIVEAGNVFVYDGGNPPRIAAQKLILATDAVVPVRAAATIVPAASGSLQIDATITGAAAGDQSLISLTASCTDGTWSDSYPVFVPAGTPARTSTVAVLAGIPAGTTCTLTQTGDGANAYAELIASTITPESVTIAAAATSTLALTNTYALPAPPTGSLAVDVSVTGAAAGEQSALALAATCTAAADDIARAVSVPAGVTGTSTVAVIENLPVGAVCAVTQTADGRDEDAEIVSTTILPAIVSIAGGETSTITVTNDYAVPAPTTGTVIVDVTIGGAAAGEQSAISLTAACTLDDETRSWPLTVAAGATGTVTAATLPDLPAGSECAVTVDAGGANASAVLAESSVDPPTVTIGAGVMSVIAVSNTYALPAPTPTPSPSRSGLPATGMSGAPPWGVALGLLVVGAGLVGIDVIRRRRAPRR